jgi:hypothetical protein
MMNKVDRAFDALDYFTVILRMTKDGGDCMTDAAGVAEVLDVLLKDAKESIMNMFPGKDV